jgi:hypothetical protein
VQFIIPPARVCSGSQKVGARKIARCHFQVPVLKVRSQFRSQLKIFYKEPIARADPGGGYNKLHTKSDKISWLSMSKCLLKLCNHNLEIHVLYNVRFIVEISYSSLI